MNVLHVISSGGMYGAEAVILNLARTMNEMRSASEPSPKSSLGIFTSDRQPNRELYAAAAREGAEAYAIPCNGQIDLSVPAAIRALAQRLEVDVVHAHGYKADLYSWFAMRRTATPLVSTCHTWYDNDLAVRFYGRLDRWILQRFDAVIAVSSEVQTRLVKAGVPPRRIHILANGIDLRPFAIDRRPPQTTALHVGLVGRLAPEKGCDLFIRAAARILKDLPNVTFLIAGDGPDRPALERLIGELGAGQNILLAGRSEDMPAFYKSLDLLVSASRQEGLPIALLEGMAASLPLVATRAGEVPALVLDGITGLLVPLEDVPALALAISTLLRDSDLRARFGAAGRERIATHFSALRMTTEYLQVYHDVVSARRAGKSA